MDETLDEGRELPAGACHFPQYGEEYFKQLTAERLVTRIVKGFPRGSWEKERGRRNEALDCRVYARAAAAIPEDVRGAPGSGRATALHAQRPARHCPTGTRLQAGTRRHPRRRHARRSAPRPVRRLRDHPVPMRPHARARVERAKPQSRRSTFSTRLASRTVRVLRHGRLQPAVSQNRQNSTVAVGHRQGCIISKFYRTARENRPAIAMITPATRVLRSH
jgi:hypothetical protein